MRFNRFKAFSILVCLMIGFGLVGCATTSRSNVLTEQQIAALKISNIQIDTSITTIEKPEDRPRIELLRGKIKEYLTTDFADKMAVQGYVLKVKVTRVNIPNSAESTFGYAVGPLEAVVELFDPQQPAKPIAVYPVHTRVGNGLNTSMVGFVPVGLIAQAVVAAATDGMDVLAKQFSKDVYRHVMTP